MVPPIRFSYISAVDTLASPMPRLPMTLTYGNRSVDVVGLLDTGSAVNVIPYHVGVASEQNGQRKRRGYR